MGEVYRATDTSLGREVAIKMLPPDVAGDEERLARFRREAHLLASLNHPNIGAIHGLEEAKGKPFLVLELVEGEDLKQRLDKGAIPVDEALEIATQIAEALEEAHEKGIVHRDLKPANVMLTPEGKVKVLDFGLAKAYAVEAASGSMPDLSQSPTLAHTGTAAGLILGTAAYMSPEQARGKPVDKRTDMWAFGVLLWEMLTGGRSFPARPSPTRWRRSSKETWIGKRSPRRCRQAFDGCSGAASRGIPKRGSGTLPTPASSSGRPPGRKSRGGRPPVTRRSDGVGGGRGPLVQPSCSSPSPWEPQPRSGRAARKEVRTSDSP